MGSVAQLYDDPESDRLIRLAESLGEENLSEGERWRLANARDARRKQEARAAQHGGRTDALDAQVLERRFAALDAHVEWASGMIKEILPQEIGAVLAEVVGEAKEHAGAEAKKLQNDLRIETDQKLNAQFAGFETAVNELRNEDRAVLLTTVRQTLSEAESRIDGHLETALTKTWERAELEVALVRDELLNVIAAKAYGQLAEDDALKHTMAEKAIAELRKRTASLEAEGARATELAGLANQLAGLEDAHAKRSKTLLIRAATTALLLKKESSRANELAGKVERLEATLKDLIDTLLQRKVIN